MAASDALAEGTTIAGRYRVEGLLGSGGFGAVYRARTIGFDRLVALKILHPEVLARGDTLARFEREARLVQTLQHPHVVQLLDLGTGENGAPFLVFELLQGTPLDRAIATGGPMPEARAARIARQVLKALFAAHAHGVVHRDIKPANIFLASYAGESDFVKLLDFGIAALPTAAGAGLTAEGISLGTPAYMAPEQVLAQAIDGRTDIYALGLVLAEMLAGQAVFAGETSMRIVVAQASPRPVPLPPSVLASTLGPLVRRATQKDPALRFGSAADMLEWLDRVAPEQAASSGAWTSPQPSRGSPSLVSAPTLEAPRPRAVVPGSGPTSTSVAVATTAPRLAPTLVPEAQRPSRGRWILGALLAVIALLVAASALRSRADREADASRRLAEKRRAHSDSARSDEARADDAPPAPEGPDSTSDYPDAVPCAQRHPSLLSTTIHGKSPRQIYDKLEGMNYGCMAQQAERGCVATTFRTPTGTSFLLLNFCPEGVDNVVSWDRNGFIHKDDSSGATLGFADAASGRPLAELAKQVLELEDAL